MIDPLGCRREDNERLGLNHRVSSPPTRKINSGRKNQIKTLRKNPPTDVSRRSC
ncbi:MAG: hypothetical protein RLZZ37_1223 [Actinomycetota bacterium]|jgi:hypothetical protein